MTAAKEEGGLIGRIQERMELLNLNPFSAAKKAGLGSDYVRDILRGKVKSPSAERLGKLAIALECSLQQLLGEDELPRYTTEPDGKIRPMPDPLPPAPPSAGGEAVMLDIRYELISHAYRPASDVSRPALGRQAATIPPAYARIPQWYEYVRDDLMRAVIPEGSLVHVIAFDDARRADLIENDIIVIQKRIIRRNSSVHLIERSLRRVVNRLPELGMWFMEHWSGDEEQDFTDEVLREEETGRPKTVWDAGDNEPMRQIMRTVGQENNVPAERIQQAIDDLEHMTPERFKEFMAIVESDKPRVVGKVIRALTPFDRAAGFGIEGRR